MARLNTHLSATPQQQTRSSTVDSLYRDPSVAPRNAPNTRSSYSVMSPSASVSSDKENEQPDTRDDTPQPAKRRGLRGASARMPTPSSGSGSTAGGSSSKRRRTGEYSMPGTGIYVDEPQDAPGDDDDEGSDAEAVDKEDAPVPTAEDEEGDLKFYNPNQNPEQRRMLRAKIRDHTRMVDGKTMTQIVAS
jgi:hypothetical protein